MTEIDAWMPEDNSVALDELTGMIKDLYQLDPDAELSMSVENLITLMTAYRYAVFMLLMHGRYQLPED